MIKAGIVGGTGYTGSELLRLLTAHPQVDIIAVTSRADAGTPVTAMFPHLRGHLDLAFSDPEQTCLDNCDLVFFATPNGTAMRQAGDLLAAGVRVIDLAADFRLPDAHLWERWYGMVHAAPHLLDEAVYGLPEINREAIRTARLVANPGCYPTAVTLGLLPLIELDDIAASPIIADVKSGVSGAGRKAATPLLMAEAGESFKAYSVTGHRHQPEILTNLRRATGREISLTFVPHLVPMVRGIEATLYACWQGPRQDLQAHYEARYRDEPFIDLLPGGSALETRSVRGTNLCRLAINEPLDAGVVVVQAVIDNLVKGAAGQAVQNLNLMFGLDERLGLEPMLALVP
ncbi:MAG: N-acetyl-gamma-glutamyl-phosphate reductase [Chromatiaceae bacterium]|nr:MAG: N-acetyl-gamma-glutamyl-phosphate reductase [Chromatiaceae bacterium]